MQFNDPAQPVTEVQPNDELDSYSVGPVALFTPENDDFEGEIVRGMLESEGIRAIYDSHVLVKNIWLPLMSDPPTRSVLVSAADETRAREAVAAFMQPVTDDDINAAADALGA